MNDFYRIQIMADGSSSYVPDLKLSEGYTQNDCTCYHTCGDDSHSGHWHQHEDEPCPIHVDAPMVG